MCILCVVQKWSRRVATMLPWLVLPLIGLWALSQLLPPGFRFEVTSPRLACVLVLLITIFWYEILMPQLSAWRAKRNAFNRERKRLEAIERQKLRKTATRLCRNCLGPYKDQNPSGGRFTCSYCGHVSKRPALDLSGLDEGLGSKSGKVVSGKVTYCRGKDGGDDCSGFFACKRLTSYLMNIRWACIKSFVAGWFTDSDSTDGEFDGLKKGDGQLNCCESKGEKARRKAEEKRQARLEREQLEEEERKQREEVARLVEQQRKMKEEENKEAEKERHRSSAFDRRRDSKRESEKKAQERRKEKDRGSSKSNSDAEDNSKNEKKHSTGTERRDNAKSVTGSVKVNTSELVNGTKVASKDNFSRATGAKYLERVKGSILSSSKAFNGSSFFGKGAQTSTNVVTKASKPNGSVDNVQTFASWRDPNPFDHTPTKASSNGGEKITEAISHRPVASEVKPQPTPKKSWQQLFTRMPASPVSSNADAINRSDLNYQAIDRSPQLNSQVSPTHPLDNQTFFSLSSPFSLPNFPNSSISSSPIFSSAIVPTLPPSGKLTFSEPEIFEDPCYVPDPISLLGPVSESLDNFPLDPVSGFTTDFGSSLHSLKNIPAPSEVNRPSPIESPMSRLKVVEERRANFTQYPFTPNTLDMKSSFMNNSSNIHEQGTWQMWGTPPLAQDGLGLVGRPVSWLLPLGQTSANAPNLHHPSPYKATVPEFATDNLVLPDTCYPQTVHFSDCQDGGTFSPLAPCSGNDMFYGSPSRSATSHPYGLPPANCWFNDGLAVHGSGEGSDSSFHGKPYGGGRFPATDVQSIWSSN